MSNWSPIYYFINCILTKFYYGFKYFQIIHLPDKDKEWNSRVMELLEHDLVEICGCCELVGIAEMI